MFTADVKKEYGVTGIESNAMRTAINDWLSIYRGFAPWVDDDDAIKTIKFAKYLCEETARLVCLDIDCSFDGPKAKEMQEFWDKSVYPRLCERVETGIAAGSFILKPNGEGVDFITPDNFQITAKDGNGKITGCVFQDSYQRDDFYYTKLENHSFWTAQVKMPDAEEYEERTFYRIENKAFISKEPGKIGKPIDLQNTKWSNLLPVVDIIRKNNDKLDGMMFGFFKMPAANDIDIDSPLGLSIFSNAIEELKDLDIAYSRNSEEIHDSGKIVMVDDRLTSRMDTNEFGKRKRVNLKLPKFVKNVTSVTDDKNFYEEINPTLNTDERKVGINFQLSLIGRKCGYSNGYFVLDQKTGMITATQVEADDRETIQTVKNIRDSLAVCIEELFNAQSVMMDLYETAPVGEYAATFSWGDITYNYEEDKQNWWKYVQAGKAPAWMYFMKFEGMSEDEAKAMSSEMDKANANKGLFGDE